MTAHVYIACLDTPIGDISRPHAYARHYAGSAVNWQARLQEHRDGRGARMLAAANERGITYQVTRLYVCPDIITAKQLEQLIKARSHLIMHCPRCRGRQAEETPLITCINSLNYFKPRKPVKEIIERRQERLNRRAAARQGRTLVDLPEIELLTETQAWQRGIPLREINLAVPVGDYPIEW